MCTAKVGKAKVVNISCLRFVRGRLVNNGRLPKFVLGAAAAVFVPVYTASR